MFKKSTIAFWIVALLVVLPQVLAPIFELTASTMLKIFQGVDQQVNPEWAKQLLDGSKGISHFSSTVTVFGNYYFLYLLMPAYALLNLQGNRKYLIPFTVVVLGAPAAIRLLLWPCAYALGRGHGWMQSIGYGLYLNTAVSYGVGICGVCYLARLLLKNRQ